MSGKTRASPFLTRRELLSFLGSAPLIGLAGTGCGSDEPVHSGSESGPWPGISVADSRFGHWRLENRVPAFVYDADHQAMPEAEWERFLLPPTRRHWMPISARNRERCFDHPKYSRAYVIVSRSRVRVIPTKQFRRSSCISRLSAPLLIA